VSEELIRVAILRHERWHEALEEASRLYFGERNDQAMLRTLLPLHSMMDKEPETLNEVAFNQVKHILVNVVFKFREELCIFILI
jgi:FKBP12-rapamycin complex-associated protein